MLERAVALGIFLPQREAQLSGGRVDGVGLLTRLDRAGRFSALRAGDDDQQVLCIRFCQLANLCDCVREGLFQPLDVLENLGVFAIAEHRLDLVALFARELADLRDDDGDHGKLGIDLQRLQVFGREGLAHVGHCRQAQVGLVDAVEADRLVVAHLRERRLQLRADGLERRGQKAFDTF